VLPDFPREYGEYWNPAKEWDADTLEEIADVLSDFKPPDFMPVELAERNAPPVIDANELLCGTGAGQPGPRAPQLDPGGA
jgi:hypothetical protein